ncbi:MAG TPA: GEVED domain-containing protein, partial [Bacteroidales bacterium]|nr:GEVED domain-containing protein [Bacteroidales bacterium]
INADSLTGATGLAGVECNGVNFFAAEWGSAGHRTLFKLTMTGQYVDSISTAFTGSTTAGLRDLAWDGTYLYGGIATNAIYCFDVNGTYISTITSPTAVRAIAYDEVSDAFWVNNFSTNFILVSRTGVALDTIATPPSCYGAAYDNVTAGGPYLWLFTGTSSATNTCAVERFSIATGLGTGVTHSVSGDLGAGISGGLFSHPNIVPGKFTLGGLMQGAQDIFGYEIGTIATQTYCGAAGGCDEYISNVTLGSINNSSSCSGYHDYTNLTASVNLGVPFTVTVTNGIPYTGDQCGMWVDWNQNQNFADDAPITVTGGPAIFTATITPPATATLGNTRIRIRITFTGTYGPCDTTTYGEVEDYTLNVSAQSLVDAGVASITPVGPNAGSYPVTVTIKNYGLDTLTSANIGFNVNGVAGTPYAWTGSLLPLATSAPIVINSAFAFGQGNNTITAWTSLPNGVADGNTANDSASWTGYFYGAISTFPYTESFENGMGNWQQPTTDDFDWTRSNAPTPSSPTGPDLAYDGSWYLFTESSSPRVVGDEAYLDCNFNLASQLHMNLKFWYHMYGASTGTLHLDVLVDTVWNLNVWSMTGDKGNQWFEAMVPLDSVACGHANVTIRFRGTMAADGTGTVYWGDMGLDKISMEVPQASDLGIFAINDPSTGPLTSSEPVEVVIRNFGLSAQSNFTVSYNVNGGTAVTETVAGPLAGAADLVYTFTAHANLGTSNTTYAIKAWTNLSNDLNHANDTATKSVFNNYGLYCAASGGGDEFISNVTAGTINNTTGELGYTDYTSLSTNITMGNPLTVTVTNGNPYTGDQCGIWVDWNKNGSFYDDGAITVSGQGGGGPYVANIVPPPTADTGDVRMRVRITYTGALDPCGTTLYGEVEDYTLHVMPSVANDVGVETIDMFPMYGAGAIVPKATVRNFGSAAQTFTVTMTIGAYTSTQTITSLAAYMAQQVSFPVWTAAAGSYNAQVSTTLTGDMVPGNDSMSMPIMIASGSTQPKGLLEEFTSSTCAPCASFNSGTFTPWLSTYGDSVTLIKYQMSWPSPGDPYYTAQGGTRRTYYGVNAVPDLYWNGAGSQMSTAGLTSQLTTLATKMTFWDISASATVTGNVVDVTMTIDPYISGTLTAHMVVVEKTTTGNVMSNGETSFKHVMMWMMPSANGTPVNLVDGQTYTLTGSKDMSTTNVEQMSDLAVVVFLQDDATKEVVQSEYAEIVVGVNEIGAGALRLYPNPSSGMIMVEGAEGALVRVYNTLGELIWSEASFDAGMIDLSDQPAGSYVVQVTTDRGNVTRKVMLID